MNRGELSAELKRRALEVGFDLAGIARLGPSTTGNALRRWLAAGMNAGMAYLERHLEVRLDPRRLLPSARSILCVAVSYAPGDSSSVARSRRNVARYACGEDYHPWMRARLEAAADSLVDLVPGLAWRAVVDTAPLLEREWAARAGLGAIGKNGLLIHPELGSWLLLGSLLLSVDLEPDLPLGDLCGDCTACLEECPTQAFPAPYVLDSRRCISYWTIEHRGEFPKAPEPRLDGWVFGCDRCQEVCPWNRSARPGRHVELGGNAAMAFLEPAWLAALPDDRSRSRFRSTALDRAKPEGLRRNARRTLAEEGGGEGAGRS